MVKIMKIKIIIVAVFISSFFACEKSDFDIKNPDVEIFVKQLKNGTYNQYEKNEEGEELWLKMPEFKKQHIGKLIELAADTTHIINFPINPVSSRYPTPQGRDFILGECLLWIVDGIIKNVEFTSLDPYLINISLHEKNIYKGISCKEILEIQKLYKKWWKENKYKKEIKSYPLEGTNYKWF